MNDGDLRDLVRQSLEARARANTEDGPSFHALWSRAIARHAGSRRQRSPSRWWGYALAPALALAAIMLISHQRREPLFVEPLPIFETTLPLPTDRLRAEAEAAFAANFVIWQRPDFDFISLQYPTDSLNWRTS